MRPSFFVMPVVLAVAAVPVLAAPASAGRHAQPVCGTTLTRDTVLTRDLTCSGDGLTLGEGVDLDLRGHTLRGPGSGTALRVTIDGSNRIRGGTVTGWDTGVGLLPEDFDDPDASGPLAVERMAFRDNRYGVDASGLLVEGGSKPTTVTRSSFTGNRAGVVSAWFSRVTVDRSRFTGNWTGVWSESDLTVGRSSFVRNTTAVRVYEGGVQVSRSTFRDNPESVTVAGVGYAGISRSRFVGGDVTLTAGALGTVDVRDSVVVGSGTGMLVDEGSGVVERSTFRGNDIGLRHVGSDWGATTVRASLFHRNGDGILSESGGPELELGDNSVRRNTRWGIHAPGAVDLGGNRASGNGNDPQCVGVVCEP